MRVRVRVCTHIYIWMYIDSVTLIFICANLFNVCLNRKELDVLTCCFISPLTTCHFHGSEPSGQDR